MVTRFTQLVWFAMVAAVAFLALFPVSVARAAGEGSINVGTGDSPLQKWQYLVGLIVPLVVAWLTKYQWKQSTKVAIMFAVSLLATIGTLWLQGSLNDISASTFVDKVLGVMVMAIAFYHGVWKPIGVAPAILENVKSPLPG